MKRNKIFLIINQFIIGIDLMASGKKSDLNPYESPSHLRIMKFTYI